MSANSSSDLFSDIGAHFESIPIQDGELHFARNFFPSTKADRYFESLLTEVPWKEETVWVWGKEHVQPRLVAWFGDPGLSYAYSGLQLNPLPWTTLLSKIREEIESSTQRMWQHAKFNSVLLNLYRTGKDRMGWHSDDEPALGANPIIASVSLGDERIFKFKHKHKKSLKPRVLRLPHGSLLIMAGSTQQFWQHAIEREASFRRPRINLTFRNIKHLK